MVGAFNWLMIDLYVLLRADPRHHALHIGSARDGIARAVEDEARGWARRQEREIVMVGWGRKRQEAVNLRAAHQKLQADPGPERIAANPALLGAGVHGLEI